MTDTASTYQLTRSIPAEAPYDLVVAGGGPAGTAAAVCAARRGLKVLLAEATGCLGGMGTSGLVSSFGPVSDGERMLVGGTALAGVAYLIAGQAGGLAVLLVALLLGGLGASTQHPLASSIVTDTHEAGGGVHHARLKSVSTKRVGSSAVSRCGAFAGISSQSFGPIDGVVLEHHHVAVVATRFGLPHFAKL